MEAGGVYLVQGDVTDARGSGDDTAGYVLDQLGFMEEFVRETKETMALQKEQKEVRREFQRCGE